MRSRLGEIVRALGALVVLVLLLVGFPIGLAVAVGWPLPTALPTLEQIEAATRSGVDPIVLMKTLAIIGWLAWAQIALATFVEAAAIAWRTRAPRIPALPGVQFGTARLLATAALLFGTFSTPRVPAQALTAPAAVELDQHISEDRGAPRDEIRASPVPGTDARPVMVPSDVETTSYLVQRNDSWWQIAEDMLGDGLRWRELRSLNVGRVMAGGETITTATETIHEGWELLVPTLEPVVSHHVPAADVVVERGDNLWDLAEKHMEESLGHDVGDAAVVPYWQDTIDENQDRFVDPRNPSLIYPGQTLHLPAAGDRSAEETPEPESPPQPDPPPVDAPREPAPPVDEATPTTVASTPAPNTPDPGAEADGPGEDAEDVEDRDESALAAGPLLGIAGALLAVGLSASLLRTRRRREQSLPRGASLEDPAEDLEELRAEVVVREDLDAIELMTRSLHSVTEQLGDRGSSAQPRLVQVGEGSVEVVLSAPVLPEGEMWHTEGEGTGWVLTESGLTSLVQTNGPSVATSPLLISVGAPDEAGHLLLDLEAEGLVNINGTPEDVVGFVRSVLFELSTSPLAGGVSVYVCGSAQEFVDTQILDRLDSVERWDDIADSTLSWAHQTRDVLASNNWATPNIARAESDRFDEVAPTVVVLTEEPTDERFSALCTLITESPIPVVVVGVGTRIEGGTDIDVADGYLQIASLELRCHAQSVPAEVGARIIELLEHAAEGPIEDAAPPTTDSKPETSDQGVPGETPTTVDQEYVVERYCDPPFDVLVRVLGDIEVVGGHKSLTAIPTAIVTYIALNSPTTAERIENAIWNGPTENRRSRFANNMSTARSSLGAEHLPTASDKKYRVGPRVATDLELLESRIDEARSRPCDEATEILRGALEYVTGPVFTYSNSDRHLYSWVSTENWISSTELKVTNLAEELSERYLRAGDHDGAAWAASRGLASVPVHTRLTGALMRAYAAAGDPHAATSVYESYTDALDALDLDEHDADLAELCQRLRSGENPDA